MSLFRDLFWAGEAPRASDSDVEPAMNSAEQVRDPNQPIGAMTTPGTTRPFLDAPSYLRGYNGVPVIMIPPPGFGEASQWVMDTTFAFVQSDWSGPHLPYTRRFCQTPNCTSKTFLIDTLTLRVDPNPQYTQIPTPQPLTLY
jgi:hypothetical protein